MTTVSIRLPDELAKTLKGLAFATERSKTFIIRKAIETYVAEYADYQIALDRLNDKDDAVVPSAEFKKQLG